MSLVLDASIAAKWFLYDERSSFANAILERVEQNGACAPALFRLEIENILLVAERAGRISAELADEALDALRDLPLHLEPPGTRFHAGSEMTLARHYDLTPYDAAYLALAAGNGMPLATDDSALSYAARDLGIHVLQPTR